MEKDEIKQIAKEVFVEELHKINIEREERWKLIKQMLYPSLPCDEHK